MRKEITTGVIVLLTVLGMLSAGAQTVKVQLGDILKVKLSSNEEGLYDLENVSVKTGTVNLRATGERVEVHHGFADFIMLRKGGGGLRIDSGRTWAESLFMTTEAHEEDEKWITDSRRYSDRHLKSTFGFRASGVPGMKVELTNHLDLVYGMYTDAKAEITFRVGNMKTKVSSNVREESKTEIQTTLGSRFRGFELKTGWVREYGQAPLFGGTSRRQKNSGTVYVTCRDLELKISNVHNVYESTGSKSESAWQVKFDNENAQLVLKGKLQRTEGTEYGFTQPQMTVKLRITRRTDAGTLGFEINGDRTFRLVFRSEVPGVGAGELGLTCDIDSQLSET